MSEENKINPVEKVTITKKTTLYKNNEPANSIEMINFSFSNGESCGFNLVSQKGLYEIGDEAFYIQPDYCVEDNELFSGFVKPDGDVKKSRLGKNGRIRALKFNFNTKDSFEPVYSMGILLQKKLVTEFLKNQDDSLKDAPLDVRLGVTKYEEPETGGSGVSKGLFPSWGYKTDETNIFNQIGVLEQCIEDKELLGYSLKYDGSSISIYSKQDVQQNGEWIFGVCSRGLEKYLEQKQVTGYIDSDNNEVTKYYDKETNQKGFRYKDVFHTQEQIDCLVNTGVISPILKDVKDSWVELAKKYNLHKTLPELCKSHNKPLMLRGEIYGQGLKGSGNKSNPHANEPQSLILFGVDDISSGYTKRIPFYNDIGLGLKEISELLNVSYAENINEKVYSSKEELFSEIEAYFKQEESKGRIVEGVVIRTLNNNRLSGKYMNAVYDARK